MTTPVSALAGALGALVLSSTALAQTVELHTFPGDGLGDDLGLSVASAGDVNNDGRSDLVLGAPELDQTIPFGIGYARVISGMDGSTLYTFAGARWLSGFGQSVAGAGDLNSDGHDDVLVGAPTDYSEGGSSNARGIVYAYSGADGSLLHAWPGLTLGDSFGTTVACAGDVNGDGYDDAIAGGPLHDTNGLSSGVAVVFSGRDGSMLHTLYGAQAQDGFGSQVTGIGDFNQDGKDDFAVASISGSVRVFSGSNGSLIRTFFADDPTDGFGSGICGIGDLTGDGRPEIVIGARQDDDGNSEAGVVRVYNIANGAIVHEWMSHGTLDLFGRSVSSGHIDNDGVPDVFVGASGFTRAYSGATGAEIFELSRPSPFNGFGMSVAVVGDVDNDGVAEVAVGVPTEDSSGPFTGAARLYDVQVNTGPVNYCLVSPNSAGSGATIGWGGTLSVAANNFRLTASGTVPQTTGIFFYGSEQTIAPFCDGYMCVAGTIFRLNPGNLANGQGHVVRTLDFNRHPMDSGAGMVTAGSTWNFQYWFRDPGSGSQSPFNLSNGLRVTFQP